MMMRITTTVVMVVCLSSLLGARAFDSKRVSLQQEDAKRKGMDISLTYDQRGKLEKFSIKSNQMEQDEPLPILLKREDVQTVMEEIVPELDRGAILRQYTGIALRSAYIETTVYEKVQIDVTISCRKDVCGISYVEGTQRSKAGH
jgi:uncharacterized lipoprotein YehR (DUF1307 family)